MTLHKAAQQFIDQFSAFATPDYASLDIKTYRKSWSNLITPEFIGEKINIADIKDTFISYQARNIPIRIYRPKLTNDLMPTLIYLPGGAFIIENLIRSHDRICRELCDLSQWQVITIEYCAAPELAYPHALQEILFALIYLYQNHQKYHIDTQQFVLGGDSAGAHFTAIAAQQLHPHSIKLAAQVMISPPLNAHRSSTSHQIYGQGYLLNKEYTDWIYSLYLPRDINLNDIRISPIFNKNLVHLPPTLIINAECDPVKDDGAAYSQFLKKAGVKTQYSCYAGLIHAFLLFRGKAALMDTPNPLIEVADFLKESV